jgi:hypothetical protein
LYSLLLINKKRQGSKSVAEAALLRFIIIVLEAKEDSNHGFEDEEAEHQEQ